MWVFFFFLTLPWKLSSIKTNTSLRRRISDSTFLLINTGLLLFLSFFFFKSYLMLQSQRCSGLGVCFFFYKVNQSLRMTQTLLLRRCSVVKRVVHIYSFILDSSPRTLVAFGLSKLKWSHRGHNLLQAQRMRFKLKCISKPRVVAEYGMGKVEAHVTSSLCSKGVQRRLRRFSNLKLNLKFSGSGKPHFSPFS